MFKTSNFNIMFCALLVVPYCLQANYEQSDSYKNFMQEVAILFSDHYAFSSAIVAQLNIINEKIGQLGTTVGGRKFDNVRNELDQEIDVLKQLLDQDSELLDALDPLTDKGWAGYDYSDKAQRKELNELESERGDVVMDGYNKWLVELEALENKLRVLQSQHDTKITEDNKKAMKDDFTVPVEHQFFNYNL